MRRTDEPTHPLQEPFGECDALDDLRGKRASTSHADQSHSFRGGDFRENGVARARDARDVAGRIRAAQQGPIQMPVPWILHTPGKAPVKYVPEILP